MQVQYKRNRKDVMSTNTIKTLKQLEKFEADTSVKELNKKIKTLKEKEQNKFNIFKVLKLENHEIRHSNFLAWLLNPKENHGLGDKFLKNFMQEALKKPSILLDTSDVVVDTEYFTNKGCRIDILIHSKKSDFVCVIENKYGSDEHDEQCKHYKDFIENYSKFKEYQNQKYIFLDIDMPSQEELDKALNCYMPITYKEVYYILVDLLNTLEQSDDAKHAIVQYTEIIKEKYFIMNEEIKEKCRELYMGYYDVFNSVVEYKESLYSDMYNLMKKFLERYISEYENADLKGCGYLDKTHKQAGIRFIPKGIYGDREVSSNNRITKYPVFFTLEYNKNLYLNIIKVDKKENWHTQKSITINDAQPEDKILEDIYEKARELINKFKDCID